MAYTKVPRTIYKRSDSSCYYYSIKNPITGKYERKSTHEKDYDRAMKVYQREVARINADGMFLSLRDALLLYTDPNTNPRKRSRELEGKRFSKVYIQAFKRDSTWLLDILEREAPKLLDLGMDEFRTINIKQIKEIILSNRGRTRSAQAIFSHFKSIFSQAHEDGYIEVNPASGIKNISYEEKKREAIDSYIIAQLIARKNAFCNIEDWAFFTIIATTGMRRSEVLALSPSQLDGNVLMIDRAVKSWDLEDIGLPKCDVSRTIVLSKTTLDAISSIKPTKGRFFYRSWTWAVGSFERIRKTAMKVLPEYREEWSRMTAHVLRHSMFSNLICEGANRQLAEEYLSWAHQDLGEMPKRYLHIYARNLQEIADLIDELYGATPKSDAIRFVKRV